MKNINELFSVKNRPIRVMQFGEGNFLRCFVDWFIQNLDERPEYGFNSNVVVVQPIESGMVRKIEAQGGVYTTILEGMANGKPVSVFKVIDCLGDFIDPYTEYSKYLKYAESDELEFIFSNTTEAGIILNKEDTDFEKTPVTYPAKLLSFLFHRYEYFKGNPSKGLNIICCELIDDNGDELKKVMEALSRIKGMDEAFISWLLTANHFYNSLVDRIVAGYPRLEEQDFFEKLGYIDHFMVKGEFFHLWVIEDHYHLEKKFPLDKFMNVKFVDDVTPYKERKVRILNGAHTLLVPVSYLSGHDTVGETMKDSELARFVKGFLYDEAVPMIPLDHDDMMNFAHAVLERYQNPYVRHELMSIALNSITKYKTRLLPTVLENLEKGNFPSNALYSLGALIVFYRGKRGNDPITLTDNPEFLQLFKDLWANYDGTKDSVKNLVYQVLSLKSHWEADLSLYKGVLDYVTDSVVAILKDGPKNSFFFEHCHFED